ncbi:transposase [Runella sp. MFBS21]|uniref:transposase n=1 Tax=Runella sp. MFBS21 TaxID=3034018 RepID=UPI0023FA10F8|nr:transposase [Runella sp. MFBS21]MDF7822257.1 transposase [Runella sp. MFBS21]
MLSVYERPIQSRRNRLCFDERPCQLLEEVIAALPTLPGKAAKEDNEYIRKGTCVILLAYDLDTGQRYVQVRQRRTKADYAEFIHELLTTHYAHCEQIDLIQDNLNTHKYGSFYEHLPLVQARELSRKLVFHYTPKHGSWLNAAERGGPSH